MKGNGLNICYCLFLGPIEAHFTDCRNPVNYFLKYFDPDVTESIIYQSNLYITQTERRVNILTKPELYGFFWNKYGDGVSWSSIMERLLEVGAGPDGSFYIRRYALQQIFTNIIKHSYER